MAIRYDRRASPNYLPLSVAPDSPAHWSTTAAVGCGRSISSSGATRTRERTWASLYVGLTKVLDLRHRASGFSCVAHPTHATEANGWDPSWQAATTIGWPARWPQVEDYLERAIPLVAGRFLKEGAVQSAVSAFRNDDLMVLDREAAVTFGSTDEKSCASPVRWPHRGSTR